MRLDVWLVEQGRYPSRARAQAAIKAGKVKVDGKPTTKPSLNISDGMTVSTEPDHHYVSRAALKLLQGLTNFDIDPNRMICLDIGSSTGGFTQVLTEAGAKKVYAVDVGTDQLHPLIHAAKQVILLEQQDARELTRKHIPDPIDLIVCDASFISATKVLDVPLNFARHGAYLITLVKPQFEVGRQRIGKGGIVTDPEAHRDAVKIVSEWLSTKDWTVMQICESPIQGGSGNQEFLLYARKA